jgi:hypothetical protein
MGYSFSLKRICTVLSFSLLVFLYISKAQAQNNLQIFVEDVDTKPNIPINVVCPSIKKKFLIHQLEGDITFLTNKQLSRKVIKDGILPQFDRSVSFAEGIFRASSIIDSKNHCEFKVVSVNEGTIDASLSKLEEAGKRAIFSGKGWVIIEDILDTRFISSAATSGNVGETDTLYEDGRNPANYPKFACFRPYDPTTLSRYSYGIVHWNRDNPARNGYSLKDEFRQSEWVSSLRCPKGPLQSEHQVDGIYNIVWDLQFGARALKVPDHCSATFNIDAQNKRFWSCCCTASLIPFKGKCRWINPITLDNKPDNGWPNAATRRCG